MSPRLDHTKIKSIESKVSGVRRALTVSIKCNIGPVYDEYKVRLLLCKLRNKVHLNADLLLCLKPP